MPASVKKLRAVESSAPATSDVTVTPVQSAADREAFIRFPYTLYAGDPNWVPPLEMERKDFLDPKKNPWFEFGNAELFLARRNGQVVGRIAAVDDPHWNDFYKSRTGFFGMFESIDDPAVAKGLFDAAASWVKAQGFAEMMGPFNFSTNYECAVLVEGFEAPPAVMMSYNPRYYDALYT
ncbi:MAG TPA: N-acetyltransferase, partial [Myxococcaceae bacterium]